MIETVLCIDIGTTSLKAGLITVDGEVVSISSKKFSDPQNRFIATKWLGALERIVKDMPADLIEGIQGITVSGNGPTVVSSEGITLRWNENIDYKAIGVDTSLTVPSLFLPRILSFKTLFPKSFDNSRYIFSGPEFLIYELTGRAVTILPEERFLAAYWDEERLIKCEVPVGKMPEYVSTGQICGYVTEEIAGFLKIKTGIPVIAGGPDFVVALMGTNTLQSGYVCDRCGSSEGFNFCVPSFIKDEEVRSLPSVIPGLWNVSVLIVKSSGISEAKRFDFAKKAVSVLKRIAEANNIDFPEKITVTGGQAANEKLMQDKAKTLGVKLVACQCPHAELLGDACAGWYGIGKYKSLQESANAIVKEDKVYDCL